MPTTISSVVEGFGFLFESLFDREFRKTLKFTEMRERDLLPLVRTFLLGYFWKVAPETRSSLPGSLTGRGSIDFVVDNVAIEFAVRRPTDPRSRLSHVTNATEIKKLLRHRGLAVLVLFDFSKNPFDEAALERFREWPSLGKGNHRISAFNVAYFYRERIGKNGIVCKCIRKNIRI
ncbi:hypothetical protein EN866_24205 [Mesorhizobium sp. M2D.F.Ca.ET.223.01.1.1]|uniref:hypothetical protein n=1 Tax=Mesorhizobium sp. M2D.F.Ca.ET.223.01.1.1 TaxID=2563940 RepID=UPI0010929598|nr:hypothetical protein [Mesorhizobium sp. M2D.F.Ca.ET.223.01.1.1]TGP86403.1 hypothetical protein EN864_24215 [bacterium M00.F.Ca.ET.221.01.1.1]TGR88745.1 hypothetical protein EN866_24205 [Mesorhizobium sp. M2D.F.Ca.ET.223.01.1.1]